MRCRFGTRAMRRDTNIISKTAIGKARFSALVFAVMFVGQLTAAFAVSTGTSRIGITKLATLQVANMETDQFYSDQSEQFMTSNICLQTGGEPVPYRVSASSLKGKQGFQVTNSDQHSQINYDVVWAGENDQYRLNDSSDVTDVIQANAGAGCDNRTLSIQMDDQTFASATSDAHTDTLSLIFVIE